VEVSENIAAKAEEMFLKFGIKSISMDDISRHIGISKKTLYQHIPNKSELVKVVLETKFSEHCERVEGIQLESKDPIEEVLLFARMVIEMLVQMSPSVIYDLQKYYLDLWKFVATRRHDLIYQVLFANLEEGKKRGIYRDDIDTDLIASLYVRMSTFMFDQKAIDAPRARKIKLYYEFVKYHIRGIATQNGHDLLNQYEYFWHE